MIRGEVVLGRIRYITILFLSMCTFTLLFLGEAHPTDIHGFYRDYLIQRMMIDKVRELRGDSTAGSLLNDLSREAKRMGFQVPVWSGTGFERVLRPGNHLVVRKEKNVGKLGPIISKAARTYDLPQELIRAVIHVESAFLNESVSSKGAQGLMQLMPETADDLGISNPFDAKANIFGGSRLLKQHLLEFRSLKKALIAYNAGPGWVRKGKGIPRETRRYIRKVIHFYNIYKINP